MLNFSTTNNTNDNYLYTSEEIKTLIDLLPVGVSILNSERKIVAMNKALELILGYTHDQLINGAYKTRKYFNADNSEMTSEEFPSARAIKEQKIISDVEIKVVSEDGDLLWLNVSASPIHSKEGACIIVTTDITAKKELEQNLLLNETIFSEFLRNIPAFVYIKDKDLKLVKISKNMEELLGKPSNELIGKDSYDLLPLDFAKTAVSDDKKVLSESLVLKREESINNRIYTTTKFPIVIKENEVLYFAGYSVDITELKAAEENLKRKIEEVNKMNQYMVGRELKMIELKNKIDELEQKNVELS